ncbi:MGH1-like glycoside hydrolase domain-containing protein [Roseimaritima ulvae]|uniref:Mannosyl oligosaccharide glucosidase n=1 Tax=Roseimaritima ulvae TaxID=980254 RepID=A0A5B9QPR8_9BACT|nr:glucosidase [Roseimaritima ulvae]QEG39670.1 Mannosyl oligosaccharide glucosidase [Roseimaritima ulvae]
MSKFASIEDRRLHESQQREQNWQRWGPYLSERQWGTVREDYSSDGNSWAYFPHDHARSRAYRWGEDGLLGLCDRECRLCFSLALWNGRDAILKERLFGLTGPEGNHGEDVKECYYYLDSSPTHSYMRGLYKYPQARFPYLPLTDVNRQRSREEPEYELTDTGVFDEQRYFDVQLEYSKASPDDILVRIRITNRGPQAAVLHALPQFWFRNTWTWHCTDEGCTLPPKLWLHGDTVLSDHESLGAFSFAADVGPEGNSPTWLFTDNETNTDRHPGLPREGEYSKDAFHRYVVLGQTQAVNPRQRGTKSAAYYLLMLQPGESQELRCRISPTELTQQPGWQPFGQNFAQTFGQRQTDCDEFYKTRIPASLSEDRRNIMRQAYAGLLWSKQFYHYVVRSWLEGDPAGPTPPAGRGEIRNGEWQHLFNRDILVMPDTWEYPWYAAWDSAFHMIPMARLDTHFAKEQLLLFLREWYMHPNGQIPAYEWQLSDVNPPVHAWAVWEVYKATGPPGQRDKLFLARAFQKLVINFTWWVNRKDPRGRNIFAGGFLGLDNIGVFDRSSQLQDGLLEQADGTAWMAFYCGAMLNIAMELADGNPAYGDMASKFFEHYVAIAEAMNCLDGNGLWDETDGFYYDHLYLAGQGTPMRIRSLVGLIPLLTGVILDDAATDKLPGFKKRMQWFLENRGEMSRHMTYLDHESTEGPVPGRRLLAIPSEDRFRRLLSVMLDESEFLSPHGIRSLSAAHRDNPFRFELQGQVEEVRYVPGESDSWMFGGNSNWRGPVWFPMNFLLIQALRRYHSFYGESFLVECPTGSGNQMTLLEVSHELERRLISIFEQTPTGRPAHGTSFSAYTDDPHWKDLVLFYEYFHGDNGSGLGASHQTGWTALVATMMQSQAQAVPAKSLEK